MWQALVHKNSSEFSMVFSNSPSMTRATAKALIWALGTAKGSATTHDRRSNGDSKNRVVLDYCQAALVRSTISKRSRTVAQVPTPPLELAKRPD